MKTLVRSLLLGALTTAVAAVAACGENGVDGGSVPDPGDATSEVDAQPGLDASSEASPTPDARAPFDASPEPVKCAEEPCAVELVAGAHHFCARMSDGTARCWGDDFDGQLGRGDGEEPTPGDGPVPPVVELSNVVQLSAASNSTCARSADGSVKCWGANYYAQLGLAAEPIADVERHPVPSPAALDGASAVRIDVGSDSACALLETGALVCWGASHFMNLARPDVWDQEIFPVALGLGNADLDASAFSRTLVSSKTSFGLTKTGEVLSWGALSGDDGLVSGIISSTSPLRRPKRLESLTNVTSLAVSRLQFREPSGSSARDRPGRPTVPAHGHGCAIANGEVFCWGRSFYGALCTGLADREHQPKRVSVPSAAWPQQIVVGDETTCVRLTDGTVQCCGTDEYGALGTGSVQGFSAVFAPASAFASQAVQLAASDDSVCALVQGGTVECWGSNRKGELGRQPDQLAYPTPTKIRF